MSEWISVEEAAKKYNLKKEYIQLWVAVSPSPDNEDF